MEIRPQSGSASMRSDKKLDLGDRPNLQELATAPRRFHFLFLPQLTATPASIELLIGIEWNTHALASLRQLRQVAHLFVSINPIQEPATTRDLQVSRHAEGPTLFVNAKY